MPPAAAPVPVATPTTAVPPVVESPATRNPLRYLFHNLARDLVSLPSRENGLVLAGGAGLALAVRPVDDNLAAWADERGSSGYTAIGRIVGDGLVQGGAAIAVYAGGALAGDHFTAHVGSDLIRAQALNAVVTRVGKVAFGRKRPGGSSDSMPSGHASATFASAAVVANHFGWKAGVPAYAAASFVGWTRVRDRVHWATDVAIGAAVGTIAGITVTRRHRDTTWAIVPAANPRSVSVMVMKLR